MIGFSREIAVKMMGFYNLKLFLEDGHSEWTHLPGHISMNLNDSECSYGNLYQGIGFGLGPRYSDMLPYIISPAGNAGQAGMGRPG